MHHADFPVIELGFFEYHISLAGTNVTINPFQTMEPDEVHGTGFVFKTCHQSFSTSLTQNFLVDDRAAELNVGHIRGNFPDRIKTGFIDVPEWVMAQRSEEHTSELQSLMRITHAV